ncbi:hypothetical protein IAQ61_005301 [Plenodomus lingam]|uniref:Uncharacterized protein n=1 Tax=Leptosphaeria maculans (strain JN3 / isolate v23.1.3 / race Av1-4-5-6-7-8) TaxID=985895 RepID=E5A748_LEPMJ|nr:hypothetical protein LEMA_P086820.1 [Plenodomus lingam JN3]KAH9872465.1 hypothetical protein IAQ61_005301 [Plenodomus lingam]CBX99443.1 hypothetical protein LEMA_P086820.1 [Plenodomus lingam JN3]
MPVAAKSYLPALTGFMVFAISYTTIVASKEGAAIDGARNRWTQQHARARNALSGGVGAEAMEGAMTK